MSIRKNDLILDTYGFIGYVTEVADNKVSVKYLFLRRPLVYNLCSGNKDASDIIIVNSKVVLTVISVIACLISLIRRK